MMSARIRGLSGELAGIAVDVSSAILLVGRDEVCDVRIHSGSVGLIHCVLILEHNWLSIRDLATTTGTFVNGSRVGRKDTALKHGDMVTLGDTAFVVELQDEIEAVEQSAKNESVDPGERSPFLPDAPGPTNKP